MATYAAGQMVGKALKWHAELDTQMRTSWIQLERTLLSYFPEPHPYGLVPAGRVLVEHWQRMQAPSFTPTTEEEWLREARQRRAAYDKAGPGALSSVHWLLVEEGESIPNTAIKMGARKNGPDMFTTRTWYKGGLHPGKAPVDWHGKH